MKIFLLLLLLSGLAFAGQDGTGNEPSNEPTDDCAYILEELDKMQTSAEGYDLILAEYEACVNNQPES